MMGHEDGARLADHGELSEEVLIPADVAFADHPKMAGRQEHRSGPSRAGCPARNRKSWMSKCRRVSMIAISVPDLAFPFCPLSRCDRVVIKERVRADEALDDALHLRQTENIAHALRLGPEPAERMPDSLYRAPPSSSLSNPLSNSSKDARLSSGRNEFVEAQKTVRDNLAICFEVSRCVRFDHETSSSFSRMYSNFRKAVLYSMPGKAGNCCGNWITRQPSCIAPTTEG